MATVSIGDHTTQVVVARGGVPQFVRLLPIDVATAATPRHDRDEVVDARAGATPRPLRGSSARAVRCAPRRRPGVTDLAARLRSTLAFFASRPNAAPLSQVFVTGAGAAVDGVLPALDGRDRHAAPRRDRRRCHRQCQGAPPAGDRHSTSSARSASRSGRRADGRDRSPAFAGLAPRQPHAAVRGRAARARQAHARVGVGRPRRDHRRAAHHRRRVLRSSSSRTSDSPRSRRRRNAAARSRSRRCRR